jgi:hypothetical protein
MSQNSTSNQPIIHAVEPIDLSSLVHSESPTAVILAIAMLISILLGSITGLIQVIQKEKTD